MSTKLHTAGLKYPLDDGISAKNADLKTYCTEALEIGLKHAVVIDPASVVTAPWVRFKCQFGCEHFGETYCCPPFSPTYRETADMLGTYNRAILFHAELAYSDKWRKFARRIKLGLVNLEGKLFKDGYYRAFAFLGGHCTFCKECANLKSEPCVSPEMARPAMESCGIDVIQTARNNGFKVNPLREKGEPINLFRMILVD